MTDDSLDIRAAWQGQPVAPVHITPDQMKARVQKIDGALRRRNRIMFWIMGFQIVVFGAASLAFPHPVVGIGAALTVIAMSYLIYQMTQQSRTVAESANAITAEPSVVFYRRALETQRDFHRGMWFWSRLTIFVPGPLIFMLGMSMRDHSSAMGFGIIAVAFALLGVVAIWLNLRMARHYQARIDALPRV